MDIRYVANACFLITLSTGERILTDPWFTGPCQQTWWNFPPVPETLKAEIWACKPDLIYISHLHHDHLHAETLAPFDRATPVLIGKMNTPNLRNGLKALGFTTFIEASFETWIPLGEKGVRALVFSDFHGNTKGDDSQIAYDLDTSLYLVDADGTRLFNAVDNTIMPADAARIAAEHGAPDVAILPYVSASLFPMAMGDYDDAQKLSAMTALRQRAKSNFRGVFEALSPRRVIPAGGEYVLGGPVAELSRFLPQPLESELAAELALIGRSDSLIKLYPGDVLRTETGGVIPDDRTSHRGFDDHDRAAYALTLADQDASFKDLGLPADLDFDWVRALKKCAANHAARRTRMGLSLPMDVYIQACGPDGGHSHLFKFALDSDVCGPVDAVSPGARGWLSYEMDEQMLLCLITAVLSWNAMEASALLTIRRQPDIYVHDLHRAMVHFTLLS
jgi:L-ascorbate metabolism protein UlaG (beta-lactamase superfamily)